tara:strand:- start:6045 stop:6227 length:183 start_codon:yes stop_codon:yes gene_type:complete
MKTETKLTESEASYAKTHGLSLKDMISFKQDMEKEMAYEIMARKEEEFNERMEWANPEID